MEILIAIYKDDDSVYGVAVPDIPGCFSWGESIEHAKENTAEAICAHVKTTLTEGMAFHFVPSVKDALQQQEQFSGALWSVINVDL